ncbi:DUF2155 domain-containing protein [Yoonia sp.]|uniref:DUF2155 domain-containing protein n=1 Tax=Yoonia sp. TaxID=2212373 RepID=UPI0023B3DD41
MRFLNQCMICLMLMATSVSSQEIVTTPLDEILQQLAPLPESSSAPQSTRIEVAGDVGGELRILDKLTGAVTDLSLQPGDVAEVGFLTISLVECRYPINNPAGDAFSYIEVLDRKNNRGLFAGWLLASAPALNAMDHPRYDIWALRCITS